MLFFSKMAHDLWSYRPSESGKTILILMRIKKKADS